VDILLFVNNNMFYSNREKTRDFTKFVSFWKNKTTDRSGNVDALLNTCAFFGPQGPNNTVMQVQIKKDARSGHKRYQAVWRHKACIREKEEEDKQEEEQEEEERAENAGHEAAAGQDDERGGKELPHWQNKEEMKRNKKKRKEKRHLSSGLVDFKIESCLKEVILHVVRLHLSGQQHHRTFAAAQNSHAELNTLWWRLIRLDHHGLAQILHHKMRCFTSMPPHASTPIVAMTTCRLRHH